MKINSKIATITFSFWVMKIAATTVGETGGDLLSMTLHMGYGVSSLILLGFFLLTLWAQLKSHAFHPILYWTVILSTSTAGTTISDFMDRSLGFGYVLGSSILIILLASILLSWRYTIGSINVNAIQSTRAEVFYWMAILASNTLGTAFGDFLADSGQLGYVTSNILISSSLAIIAILYFSTSFSRTFLFWSAFILTRPFGATMGDILTKSRDHGGLGLGTMGSTIVLLAVLMMLIFFEYFYPLRRSAGKK
jgi:uncharacterized membrane-anchored protein